MGVMLLFGIMAGIFVGVASAGYMFIHPMAERDEEIAYKDEMLENKDIELEKVTKERNELRKYKQDVENIINSKATIVDKYDKIKEVITTANVK